MRYKRCRLIALPLVLATSLWLVKPAAAVPAFAALDTDFNPDGSVPGTVVTPIGTLVDEAQAVAVQGDGKIVVAGSSSIGSGLVLALARYQTDGSLDPTFSDDGIVTTDLDPGFELRASLAIQPDGKLLVATYARNASSDYDFALVRYNTDGSLDAGFGSGGTVTTDFGGTHDFATALALQPDGKPVVAGYLALGDGTFAYALARYNTDGSLDTGFGSGGTVTTELGNVNDFRVALALQPDGKILIASGFGNATVGDADFFLARYTAEGALDTTFNPAGNGVVTTNFNAIAEWAQAVLVQPDGKILAAGLSGTGTALARYEADGTLDTGFGSSGAVLNPGSGETMNALALLPDGRIVTAGAAAVENVDKEFWLLRYDTDGTVQGAAHAAISAADDIASALALQPDGRLLAAGRSVNGTATEFAVARFVADDAPWGLTPDAFSFSDKTDVAKGSEQVSNLITVTGLDPGLLVPVTVSGGEYALNGSTTYTGAPGWVRNGDTVNVRQTAAPGAGQGSDTVLTVGGLMPGNNLAQVIGTTASDTFTTTTTASAVGGGGCLGAWSLAALVAIGVRRRVSILRIKGA